MGELKLCCFDEFMCIADKCTYTCCGSGWKVALKPEEKSIYETEPFIKRGLRPDADALRMREDGKCFFLDEKGLCELVKIYGPDVLSQTCAVFPRNSVWVHGVLEKTLSNACPWVIEMLDQIVPPLSFVYEGEELPDEFIGDLGVNIRNVIIDILQLDEIPIWKRVYLVYMLADKLKETEEVGMEKVIEDYCNIDYLKALSEALSGANVDFSILVKVSHNMYNVISADNATRSYMNDFIRDYCNKPVTIDVAEAEKKHSIFESIIKEKTVLFENIAVNYAFRQMRLKDMDELKRKAASLIIMLAMVSYNSFLVYSDKGGISWNKLYDIISYYSRIVEHNSRFSGKFMEFLYDEHQFGKGDFFVLCNNLMF